MAVTTGDACFFGHIIIIHPSQATGNRVSRVSVLCGSQNIVLSGKVIVLNGVIIRGDLANVRVGRHCVISSKAVIRPPFKKFSKGCVLTTEFLSPFLCILCLCD